MALFSPEVKHHFGPFQFGRKAGFPYSDIEKKPNVVNFRIVIPEHYHIGNLRGRLFKLLNGDLGLGHRREARISGVDEVTLEPTGGNKEGWNRDCKLCLSTVTLTREEINRHPSVREWFYFE